MENGRSNTYLILGLCCEATPNADSHLRDSVSRFFAFHELNLYIYNESGPLQHQHRISDLVSFATDLRCIAIENGIYLSGFRFLFAPILYLVMHTPDQHRKF